jgi:lysophospholipase L1-like esterase
MVAVGNSLTAGYQSGALFLDGQNAAFGNLIAEQLNLQSLLTHVNVADPGISSTPGFGRLELFFNEAGADLVQAVYDTVTFDPLPLLSNLDQIAPYSNLGVPGALLQECLSTTNSGNSLTGNSFFDFILRVPFGQPAMTQLEAAIALNPDLATFWLGSNDILGYATSGGVSPMGPFGADFATFYGLALDSLADNVNFVAVANIPDITSTPFSNYLSTTYAGMQLYGEVQGEVIALRAGMDYVLLTAKEELALGLGFSPLAPLTNAVILDAVEAELVVTTTDEYNAVIAATVATLNEGRDIEILLVDVNSYFNELAHDGYMVAGTLLTTEFISGGLFSLDGVHPGYIGYALIANQFIAAMNNGWELAIEQIDVADYLDMNPVFAPVAPEDLRVHAGFSEIIRDLF